MTAIHLQVKAWPLADVMAKLAGLAILLVVQRTLLAGVLSTSAAVAGCTVADTLRCRHQYGHSILPGSIRVRLALLCVFVLAAVAG